MIKNKKILHVGLALLLIGVFILIFNHRAPKINKEGTPSQALTPYSSEYNFRQTVNDCGPFNVAAVVRALKNAEVSSAEFSEDIKWRLPNKYTVPLGLEKQLKDNAISIKTPDVSDFTSEEKIAYLQQELAQNHPLIILGSRDDYVNYNYEHYITLLGFNKEKDEFYAYDSFFEKGSPGLTKDSNGDLPGNRNYTSDKLLDFWKGGGMYGLYEWYLIVASNENINDQ